MHTQLVFKNKETGHAQTFTIAGAGLVDDRVDEGTLRFGTQRFPGNGLVSEPGGYGAVYNILGADGRPASVVVKEQSLGDCASIECRAMAHLSKAASQAAHDAHTSMCKGQTEEALIAQGYQNLCLSLGEGISVSEHPPIHRVHGMFNRSTHTASVCSKQLYLVLPRLNKELRHIMQDVAQMQQTRARVLRCTEVMLAQLLRGLAFMHRNDLAHLDLKADNIMFTRSWHTQQPDISGKNDRFSGDGVRIIDLGLCRSWRRRSGAPPTPGGQPFETLDLRPSVGLSPQAPPEACPSDYLPSPPPLVRGDRFDAWSLGLVLDMVLRGHAHSVSWGMRCRAKQLQGQLSQQSEASDTEAWALMLAEMYASGDIRRWYWRMAVLLPGLCPSSTAQTKVHKELARGVHPCRSMPSTYTGFDWGSAVAEPVYALPKLIPAASTRPSDELKRVSNACLELLHVDPNRRKTPLELIGKGSDMARMLYLLSPPEVAQGAAASVLPATVQAAAAPRPAPATHAAPAPAPTLPRQSRAPPGLAPLGLHRPATEEVFHVAQHSHDSAEDEDAELALPIAMPMAAASADAYTAPVGLPYSSAPASQASAPGAVQWHAAEPAHTSAASGLLPYDEAKSWISQKIVDMQKAGLQMLGLIQLGEAELASASLTDVDREHCTQALHRMASTHRSWQAQLEAFYSGAQTLLGMHQSHGAPSSQPRASIPSSQVASLINRAWEPMPTLRSTFEHEYAYIRQAIPLP